MFGVIRDTWHKIAAAHRSADETGAGTVLEFFVPRLKRAFFIRMSVVALLAAVVFGFVLIPCVINGESMVPTFPAHGFTFCWRGKYLFGKPRRGDVVIIRYADKVYFLKRGSSGCPAKPWSSATATSISTGSGRPSLTCITSATGICLPGRWSRGIITWSATTGASRSNSINSARCWPEKSRELRFFRIDKDF